MHSKRQCLIGIILKSQKVSKSKERAKRRVGRARSKKEGKRRAWEGAAQKEGSSAAMAVSLILRLKQRQNVA